MVSHGAFHDASNIDHFSAGDPDGRTLQNLFRRLLRSDGMGNLGARSPPGSSAVRSNRRNWSVRWSRTGRITTCRCRRRPSSTSMIGIFGYPLFYYIVSRGLMARRARSSTSACWRSSRPISRGDTCMPGSTRVRRSFNDCRADDRDTARQSLRIASRRAELGLVHLVQCAGIIAAGWPALSFCSTAACCCPS